MKKKTAILLLSTMLALSACGNNNQNSTPENTVESSTEESSTGTQESSSSDSDVSNLDALDALGQVEVDEGLFDVELKIPAEYVGEQTQADLDALAKEHGFKSIILNEDGSATYTMTKKQHKELLQEYQNQINGTLDEMVGSEDYPNFTKIETNDNFTEFTITTKSTELDLAESFSVIAFYMYGGMYSIFSGEEVDNVSVTFVNEETGEVISTSNSKDMQ